MQVGDTVELTRSARNNFKDHIIGATAIIEKIEERSISKPLIYLSSSLTGRKGKVHTVDQGWLEVVQPDIVFEL